MGTDAREGVTVTGSSKPLRVASASALLQPCWRELPGGGKVGSQKPPSGEIEFPGKRKKNGSEVEVNGR
jgi:hypothetical protein